MAQEGTRIDAASQQLLAIARQYAADLNEAHLLVHRALVRLLRRDPHLTRHPVLSGELQREICLIRRERRPRTILEKTLHSRVEATLVGGRGRG